MDTQAQETGEGRGSLFTILDFGDFGRDPSKGDFSVNYPFGTACYTWVWDAARRVRVPVLKAWA